MTQQEIYFLKEQIILLNRELENKNLWKGQILLLEKQRDDLLDELATAICLNHKSSAGARLEAYEISMQIERSKNTTSINHVATLNTSYYVASFLQERKLIVTGSSADFMLLSKLKHELYLFYLKGQNKSHVKAFDELQDLGVYVRERDVGGRYLFFAFGIKRVDF